jgi:hypothetical protein
MKLFSEQFRVCNSDGTCQHMSRENYDLMPKKERKSYDDYGMPKGYYGPRGPLFCGASPGVCSSSHCPKLF